MDGVASVLPDRGGAMVIACSRPPQARSVFQNTLRHFFVSTGLPPLLAPTSPSPRQNCASGNNLLFRLLKLLQLTRMWKLMKLHNILRCVEYRRRLGVSTEPKQAPRGKGAL